MWAKGGGPDIAVAASAAVLPTFYVLISVPSPLHPRDEDGKERERETDTVRGGPWQPEVRQERLGSNSKCYPLSGELRGDAG